MGLNQKRGKLFEKVVKSILLQSGFSEVPVDEKIIYRASPGIMIHGLGQSHNADVLVSPPFQMPFMFPSRLIIECKCYSEELGIGFVRNILGLREDINNFEIITEKTLEKRRNYNRSALAIGDFPRFNYQVALASLTGFKITSEEFALTHRIPLINFQNFAFGPKLYDCLFDQSIPWEMIERNVCEIIEEYKNKFVIAITESGDFLFLYSETGNVEWLFDRFENDIEIHWGAEKRLWEINLVDKPDKKIYFELPKRIFEQWLKSNFDKQRALDYKGSAFKNIYVMGAISGKKRFQILHISDEFLKNATDDLDNVK
jgi:hypothetical protein